MFPPDTPVGRIGEKALLRYIRSRISHGGGVSVGIGDDAAAVETGPVSLMTTDSLVEGVHFHRDWTPARLLGRKALAVNLSDIGAMGGVSRYATVSLCLPSDTAFGFVEGFYDGLLSRAAQAGVEIVGGNLSGTGGPIVIDVTVLGHGQPLLRRSGALPGDVALVTGRLGTAAMGVRLMSEGRRLESLEPHDEAARRCLIAELDPSPPLGLGPAVAREALAHAAIDVSDGLSGDLLAVCQESGVSAWIEGDTMPIDPGMAMLARDRGLDPVTLALHGGEDYQLLMAVPVEALPRVRDVAAGMEIAVTVVGGFAKGEPALTLLTANGVAPLPPQSHQHFGGGG